MVGARVHGAPLPCAWLCCRPSPRHLPPPTTPPNPLPTLSLACLPRLPQVHLEVGYKQKIEAGRTILCTTELESIEGRKLWMKATVSDGPDGVVYATARALFVSPKPQKMIVDVGKYLLRRVVGDI